MGHIAGYHRKLTLPGRLVRRDMVWLWVGAIALGTLSIPGRIAAQDWQTMAASRQFQGEEEFTVRLKFLAGTLRVQPGGDAILYSARMRYDAEHFDPINRFSPRSSTLRIGLDADHHIGNLDVDEDSPQYLELAISRAVPTRLVMEFGAAKADIELGGLSLTRGSVKTGASETLVKFSEPNRVACRSLELAAGVARFEVHGLGNARCSRIEVSGGVGKIVLDLTGDWVRGSSTPITVKMGLGQLTLRLPRSLGVEIDISKLLVGFDEKGFMRHGSRWVTPNYEEAAARVRLEIKAVFGNIDIVWVQD